MRKLGEGAWIGFVFVPPLKRNFHHSKLFEMSPLEWMACDWASWMKTNMSVVEREILLTVVEELLPKSNTELLVVEKRLNLVVSDSFSSSFHLKPPIYISRIHILQTKSAQISYHGRRKGSNILDRAREGCHRLLSWQIQRTQWAIQVGWVGQFTTFNHDYTITEVWPQAPKRPNSPLNSFPVRQSYGALVTKLASKYP